MKRRRRIRRAKQFIIQHYFSVCMAYLVIMDLMTLMIYLYYVYLSDLLCQDKVAFIIFIAVLLFNIFSCNKIFDTLYDKRYGPDDDDW
jgi:NADH:ubiquinone oxidoreductase subunit 3 (subunit A)